MNFVRKRVSLGEPVAQSQLADGSEASWRDDQYLIPFMENDQLLMELDEALELDLDAEATTTATTTTTALDSSEALQEENA